MAYCIFYLTFFNNYSIKEYINLDYNEEEK